MGTHNETDDPATLNPPLASLSSDHTGLAAARHAILAAAADPITITIDSAGTIHLRQRFCAACLWLAPQELVGRNIKVLMPEPDRTKHDGCLTGNRPTEHTNIIGCAREVQAVRKGGETFPIGSACRKWTIRRNGRTACRYLWELSEMSRSALNLRVSSSSISTCCEQKVQDRTNAFQQSQDKLRLADRLASIGTLAASLGHDMNNVLLPVRARLDALAGGGKLWEHPCIRRTH